MAGKEIHFGTEARNRMLKGVNVLADAVAVPVVEEECRLAALARHDGHVKDGRRDLEDGREVPSERTYSSGRHVWINRVGDGARW